MKPSTWGAVPDEHCCPLCCRTPPLFCGRAALPAVQELAWWSVTLGQICGGQVPHPAGPASSDARWLLKLEIAIMCPAVVGCAGLYQGIHLCKAHTRTLRHTMQHLSHLVVVHTETQTSCYNRKHHTHVIEAKTHIAAESKQ